MNDPYVTVEQYQFLPEAQAVQMHLESEGVPVELADAETVSTDWTLGNAIGYIKLQVPQSHAEKALSILNDLRQRRQEREKSPDVDDAGQCLSCGSPLQPSEVKCSQCGWSFVAGDDPPTEPEADRLSAKPSAEPDNSMMENLRSLKRPLMMTMLLPTLAVIAMIFVLILVTIFGWFVGV